MCRLMINTYKIPGAVKLFRYDIECPPDNWNTDFKNKEYVYSDDCEDLRIKNRIGAFYFFENKATAYSTGCLAAKNNGCNKIWLTETSIIQEIQLLDLSQFENISSLLLSFDELGFDILTDKFHKFSSIGACKNLCELRPLIDKLRLINTKQQKTFEDDCEILNLSTEIGNFFYGNHRIDYFGQLLTDFTNGEYFKEMLLSRGYDGYIFRESHDSPTYCILNSKVLANPIHQEIELNN